MVISNSDRFLFDLQGFLTLPGALSQAECDNYRALVRDLERHDYRDEWREHASPGPTMGTKHEAMPRLQLNGLLRLHSDFDRLVDHPRVLPFLEDFMDRPQLTNSWTICKGPGCEAGWWHHDIQPPQYWVRHGRIQSMMLNVIWCLDDNGPDDGCLLAIPGSHKRAFDLDANSFPKEAVPGMQRITCRRGDAILLCEGVIHNGAGKSTPGTRTNVYFGYSSVHYNAMTHSPEQNRHYCMPQEVLARLSPKQREMCSWMEYARPVGASEPRLVEV
jgi:hypothetical protein